MDLTTTTIERLFYQQIKKLTLDTVEQSFDIQFSDRWCR